MTPRSRNAESYLKIWRHCGTIAEDVKRVSERNPHLRDSPEENELPRFFPMQGAGVIAMGDGRQIHCAVEHLLRGARPGEAVNMFACSYDRPVVSDCIVEAAKKGTNVDLHAHSDEVSGNTCWNMAVRTMASTVGECAELEPEEGGRRGMG